MGGKKKRGRPRMVLLNWMIKEDYSKLTERAGHRGEWRYWTTNLPRKAEKQEEKVSVAYAISQLS